MTIEIHQPELEALIQDRMDSGQFQSIEDVLIQALKTAPPPGRNDQSGRSGADLIAAMQRSPYKELELEPSRPHLPVRDVVL